MLSIVPPALRPETALPHHVEHFGIFYATGAAFGLAYFQRYHLLLPLLLIFAAGVEVMQSIVSGRHARLSDFVVDALAACVGALTALLARRVSSKIE